MLPGRGVPVQVEGRRVVGVHREVRAAGERLQVRVDLSDLVRRAREHADRVGRAVRMRVRQRAGMGRIGRADPTGEVIALVDGDHEQRVRPVDPVRCEIREEVLERGVVGLQLLLVLELARPGGRRDERVGAGVRHVDVVRVRDVAVRDGDAVLLHLGDVTERVGRQHPVEAGESAVALGIRDRRAVRVVHARVAAGDRRVDVLRAVERVEAGGSPDPGSDSSR